MNREELKSLVTVAVTGLLGMIAGSIAVWFVMIWIANAILLELGR